MVRKLLLLVIICCFAPTGFAQQACMENKVISVANSAPSHVGFKFAGAGQIFGRTAHKTLRALIPRTKVCYTHAVQAKKLFMFGYFGNTIILPSTSNCLVKINPGQTLIFDGILTNKRPNNSPRCVLE